MTMPGAANELPRSGHVPGHPPSLPSTETAPREDTDMALASLDVLAGQVAGPLVRPGDADYEEARHVRNGMIEAHPAAVARCTSTADLAAAGRYAADTGAPLALRGGGRSVPGLGTADDAVVADMSGMQSVEVAEGRRTAPAACGTTW